MNKSGYVWESIYAEHIMSEYHPESPKRILKIGEMLQKSEIARRAGKLECLPATKEQLAYIHDVNYINYIEKMKGRRVSLDPDTTASPKSWDASIMAAGGAITAVKAVIEKNVKNAYAFIRPPGHHAEHAQARGFCIFNNIAVAAELARREYNIKRIAIVDFDIHHGNGTQNAFYNTPAVFYISTHRWPFFPGTGSPMERGSGLGKGYTLNIPLEEGSDDEFLSIYESKVIPEVNQYRPDLILVSAGYDAHRSDPLGGYALSEEAYNRVTASLVRAAARNCDGRIIFVLEGGYSTEALSRCCESALSILEEG